MTNPYQAPLEKTESDRSPKSRIGLVGCGCAVAVLALIGLSFFAALFVSVDQPVPTRLPVAPAPAPAPVTPPATPVAPTPPPAAPTASP